MLSRMIGRDVLGPDGRVVGRLADLTVELDERPGPCLVERLLVQRHRAPDLLPPWAAVESFRHTGLVLADGTDDPATFATTSIADTLGADEILLGRDVLDTQVVDVVGQRLARVAEVVLARAGQNRLELVGVEVGIGGVLRRLGLPRLAARSGEDALAWTDLHLTSERGHAVQLATPRSTVHHLDARGLAALVSRLDTESATQILAARGPDVAAEVIRASQPDVGERVLRAMPHRDAAEIVAAMPADHASRWRDRLARSPALPDRPLLRSRVWPRRRHPPADVEGAGGSKP